MKPRYLPIITALIGALVLFLLVLLSGPVMAAEPSRCGEHATGLRADGTMWTGAAPRMWVGRDGYWHICQPWVPDGGDPEMPEPVAPPTCAATTVRERWTQDGRECVAPALLPATPAGRAIVLMDEAGSTRGMAAMRCVANAHAASGAVWRIEGSFCNWLYPDAEPKPKPRKPLAGDAKVGPVPRR